MILFFAIYVFTNLQEKKIATTSVKDPFPNTLTEGLGVCIHPGLSKQEIQSIADAGIKIVRMDLFWSKVETQKGKYDFKNSGYDELNSSLKEKGIKPYFILDYSNKLYDSINTEEGRKAFSRFAKAAAKRYGGQSTIWEIWNEPNLEKFWSPQPNYKEYALLLKETAPIIKKYDKSGIVVAPALAGINGDSLWWLKKVLDERTINEIDAVSVHPYRLGNPETAINDYQKLKELISQYTDKNIPIVSGEWGYTTGKQDGQQLTEIKQAEYLTRIVFVNAIEKIPISMWYDLKNDGTNPDEKEHNFGLLSYDSEPKLPYLAIQVLSKTLKGYKFVERIKAESPNDYILKFKNNKGRELLTYWTTENNHYSELQLKSGNGKIISMFGAERSIDWKNKLNLYFSSSPGYLIIEKSNEQ